MTPIQVHALLRQGESGTVEFKESTSRGCLRKAGQTLCAMLNHRGGTVIFGVSDDRRIVGQQISNGTIQDVVEMIRRIQPPVFPNVSPVDLGGDLFLVTVSIEPGTNTVSTYEDVAYRRVGTSNVQLSRDDYQRLLVERLHAQARWEIEPAAGWTMADLDETQILRTLDEAIRRGRLDELPDRDPLQVLAGLQLLTRQGELTRAAAVLFGTKARLRMDFPQCTLRLARFASTTQDEFLDNRQVQGHAFALFEAASTF